MIFAAGIGSRLRPFTDSHPKALAPVAGVPMLRRVVERLKQAGVDELVINVHHFADQIIDYVKSNNNFGIRIDISDESEMLLDTGGGLLLARHYLEHNGAVIIQNADILTDCSLAQMLGYHKSAEAMATLLVAGRKTQRYFMFSPDARLIGWTNLATGQFRPTEAVRFQSQAQLKAFGGLHIIDSDNIFEQLEKYNTSLIEKQPDCEVLNGVAKFSITDFYIETSDINVFRGYQFDQPYQWVDIGKAETLALANQLFG